MYWYGSANYACSNLGGMTWVDVKQDRSWAHYGML